MNGVAGPPRVLVTAEQLARRVPGGIGRYVESLLVGLAGLGPEGVEVTVLAARSRGGAGQRDQTLGQWPVRRSPLPPSLLGRAWRLGLAGAPPGCDVVHATAFALPPAGRGDRPVRVVTVHDLAWRRHPEASTARGRRWHEAAVRRALRGADAFVVPSTPVAEDLVGAGAPAGAVTIIPLGADHLPEPDRPGAGAVLRRAGVSGPYLLSVGTLEPRKNLTRLLAAYAAARPRLPEPWPLVVVGPPGWGQVAPIGGTGLVGLGPVSDGVLAGLYAGARLFAYVPLAEGFGLPPVEAMAAGVPVVAGTGVPSAAMALGRPAARLVDPTDVDAMAGALVEVASDEGLRAALVAAGAALAGTLTWRRTAGAHAELWRRLV